MDEEALRRARAQWQHRGQGRPPFAEQPGPGEESVWDYPRPPAIRACAAPVRVMLAGQVIGASSRALEVLETSHPPSVYLPPEDVDQTCLTRATGTSFCEWKGPATYFDVQVGGERQTRGAWCYARPFDEMRALAGFFSFYPARFACFYGDERVRPQASGFYGGWVRGGLVGPFKGEPGTERW